MIYVPMLVQFKMFIMICDMQDTNQRSDIVSLCFNSNVAVLEALSYVMWGKKNLRLHARMAQAATANLAVTSFRSLQISFHYIHVLSVACVWRQTIWCNDAIDQVYFL